MSDIFESSLRLKKSIEKVAKEVIERDTRSCLRVYKAVVITPPYVDENLGNVCQVKMIGDDTVLTLPYATCANNIVAGDRVWVQTTYNSFKNAIVWIKTDMRTDPTEPPKHYGARWDKVQAQMTRLYDAETFPTDTSNFGHFGSVNPNYSNPFDDIYPWSEIKLCNIDINLYMNLTEGKSVTECVTAWEGDPDFSYEDQYGVWRYRPSFYGKSWEDDTYRYFDVCGSEMDGYVYYPESIEGRWQGNTVDLIVSGTNQTCLLPKPGIPTNSITLNNAKSCAESYNATIDTIFSVDANLLLFAVEYANMNSQVAIGLGATDIFIVGEKLISDVTNSNVVKVSASIESVKSGMIFSIGTSTYGRQIGTFYILSSQVDPQNPSYLNVTLNANVTATSDNYWNVIGCINNPDEQIASQSGYIGINGKCNCYYRGVVMFGNFMTWTLGAYVDATERHIWIAHNEEEAILYNSLNKNIHYDTGLTIPNSSNYILELNNVSESGLLSVPPFCTVSGGSSLNPVGDYCYSDNIAANSALLRGGASNMVGAAGIFQSFWEYNNTVSTFQTSAKPRLKYR